MISSGSVKCVLHLRHRITRLEFRKSLRTSINQAGLALGKFKMTQKVYCPVKKFKNIAGSTLAGSEYSFEMACDIASTLPFRHNLP